MRQDGAAALPFGDFDPEVRLDSRLGYGFTLDGGAGLVTPWVGFGLAASAWDARLGASWERDGRLALDLEGAHRDSVGGPESRVLLTAHAEF